MMSLLVIFQCYRKVVGVTGDKAVLNQQQTGGSVASMRTDLITPSSRSSSVSSVKPGKLYKPMKILIGSSSPKVWNRYQWWRIRILLIVRKFKIFPWLPSFTFILGFEHGLLEVTSNALFCHQIKKLVELVWKSRNTCNLRQPMARTYLHLHHNR